MGEVIQFPTATRPEHSPDINVFIIRVDGIQPKDYPDTKPLSNLWDWLFGACLGWWLGG